MIHILISIKKMSDHIINYDLDYYMIAHFFCIDVFARHRFLNKSLNYLVMSHPIFRSMRHFTNLKRDDVFESLL